MTREGPIVSAVCKWKKTETFAVTVYRLNITVSFSQSMFLPSTKRIRLKKKLIE